MKDFKYVIGVIALSVVLSLTFLLISEIIFEPQKSDNQEIEVSRIERIEAKVNFLERDLDSIATSLQKLECETKGGVYASREEMVRPPTCTIKGETYKSYFGEWTLTKKLQ